MKGAISLLFVTGGGMAIFKQLKTRKVFGLVLLGIAVQIASYSTQNIQTTPIDRRIITQLNHRIPGVIDVTINTKNSDPKIIMPKYECFLPE